MRVQARCTVFRPWYSGPENARIPDMGPLSLALVAAALFATTNVDDLFLLVGFFSDRNLAHWQVVLGQIVGVAALITVSLAAALAALAFSPSYVGLFGFAPIVLGALKFRALLVDSRAGDAPAEHRAKLMGAGTLGVAVVTIASGADNIGIYTPLFAAQTQEQIAVTILVFGALTVVWCFAAWRLVSHYAIGRFIRSVAPVIVPVVLIVLGVSILYTSGAGEIIARLVR
jgi:cadmium resistance protein CadD (predicted permease)